eukprot:bmy_05654T0
MAEEELEALRKHRLVELQAKHGDPGDAAQQEAKQREAEMRNLVQLPKKVVVTHRRGRQKGDAERNNKADAIAKRVVRELVTWQLPLIPQRPDPSNYSPICIKEEIDKVQKRGFIRDLGGHGWLVNEHEPYFFPQLQLVKPSGRLIKKLTMGGKPYIIGSLPVGMPPPTPRAGPANLAGAWGIGTPLPAALPTAGPPPAPATDIRAMPQHQIQSLLFFTLWLLRILWLDLPELITITEHQVHMLVKSLKGASEDPIIVQDTSHPIVNVLQHLAALPHSHDCCSTKSNVHRKVSGSLRPKGRLQIKLPGCPNTALTTSWYLS